jgi:mono/diheme cytochrome c family protein
MIVLSFVLLSATNRLSSRRREDTSDYYKTQCVSCHGDQADLKFDQKIPDEELVRIVLKGKLVDVPPDMPAFEPKGVTPEQGQSLVTYMKHLRKSATTK